MNTIDNFQLAGLIASRICHDLISPVVAINNGLELLLDDTDADSQKQAIDLIDDSAKIAAIKLKIMRAAFGSGNILSDTCSKNDLLSLFQPLANKNKVIIEWHNPETRFFNITEARLILNLVLIILEGLPRGGEIILSTENDIIFNVSSQKLFFSDDKIDYLTGTQKIPAEPRYVGFLLLRHFLENNQNYHVKKDDNSLQIKMCSPA